MRRPLTPDQIQELETLIQNGSHIRSAAGELGVSVATVRRHVRTKGWRVQASPGGFPMQGKAKKPLITMALIDACQRADGAWPPEFFEIVGLIPLQAGNWVEALVNQPIDRIAHRRLLEMAEERDKDPGPTVLNVEVQSLADRYELFKQANRISHNFGD